MNSRERILLGALLGLLIVGGIGVVFYFAFYQDYAALNQQYQTEDAEVKKKELELLVAQQEQKRLLERNPRLQDWKQISLPDLAPKEGGGKARSPEETSKHINQLQVEYERYLSDLLRQHGFSPTSLDISPKPYDSKPIDVKAGAPAAKDKIPVFTRLPFAVKGSASYASIVDTLKAFYNEPLLQEVRSLSIVKPQTAARPPAGGNPRDGQRDAQALDVNMTVEVLIVTGATARTTLLPPDLKKGSLHVLADPQRHYQDMLAKDPFNGTRAKGPTETVATGPTEPKEAVLNFVKLTMIQNSGRRWTATFYDQSKGPPEIPVNTVTIPELVINDKYNQRAFVGTVVYINAKLLIVEEKGKYYQMQVGNSLSEAMAAPMTEKELKEFDITPKKVAVKEKEAAD